MIVRSLLHDGRLRVEAHPRLLPLLTRWLPLLPEDTPAHPAGSVVRVLPSADAPPAAPAHRRTLHLGGVDAWVEDDSAFFDGGAEVWGSVTLADGVSELRVAEGAEASVSAMWALYSACTLSAALLLGRMGRALAHAAAVAPPDGDAWLLVGDSHAGKTTTCANLVAAGWRYLSDDHVVLWRDGDGRAAVEGWPRPFHLDLGYESGTVVRQRGETDPRERWPGAWRRTAPLAGMLFPRVEAPAPTALHPAEAGGALSGLLRQSPWLLADRACAPRVLDLLRDAALLPAHALRLGLDTYTDPARLACIVGAAAPGAVRTPAPPDA
ncbi:hypothetical protein [Longimicrobium sp.]|uniref:hypothetical protein n=1 Tax=Longimicrobium sp. TaxID=2029185 RepID=UPI002E2F5728|nr:hypothetical protein [Longimicrobium sp.]HEX6037553.1 hypothetical protein [Longimicrobium sp.]